MSIDQRMADALSDLAGLIGEGVDPDLALEQAAEPYDIKSEVLRARAAGTGQFTDYVSTIRLAADVESRRRLVREFTTKYMEGGEQWTGPSDFLEHKLHGAIALKLNRCPTNMEFTWAKQARAEHIVRRQARFHAKMMQELKLTFKDRCEEG